MKKLLIAAILLAFASPALSDTTTAPELNDAGLMPTEAAREITMDSGVVVVAVPVEVPDLEKEPLTFAQELFNAAKSKDLRLVVILTIVLVVFVLRRWGSKLVPWFNTDRGGAGLAILMGVLGQAVLMLSSGGAFSAWMLVEGLINGVTAAGGVVVLKRLVNPKDLVNA